MDIKELAEKYAGQFTTTKRGNDTIVIFTDNANKKLRDAVYKAHGDRLPNDWIFSIFSSILDAVGQYNAGTIEELEDNRGEIVDGLVDVYTSDLTAWLNESPANVYYITESQEENGATTDGFQILAMAQYKAIDEVFGSVVELLEKEAQK